MIILSYLFVFIGLWQLMNVSSQAINYQNISIPISEYNSLYDISVTMNIQYWQWSLPYSQYGYPWNFTSPIYNNPCNPKYIWQGIECSDNCLKLISIGQPCHITSLNIDDRNITGYFPSSIGNFTELTIFSFIYNYITGTIPDSIGNLTQLTVFDVGSNLLTGTIPSSMGQLTNVTLFCLHENLLTGSLPASISQLKLVDSLWLFDNLLHGTLPEYIGNMSAINFFWVYENVFSGSLPISMMNMTLLNDLDVHINLFSGPFPIQFIHNPRLSEMYLETNLFLDSLPQEIGYFQQLRYINLHSNYYSSNIPNTIGNITTLVNIEFDNNIFTGTLPHEILNILDLSVLYLDNNFFSGSIPSNIGHLYKIQGLTLQNNKFSGPIPESIANITDLYELNLYSNDFTSTIPWEISQMPSLVNLYLFDNLLTGTIPSQLFHLSDVLCIDVDSNLLSGSLPALNSSLYYLYISNNMFSQSFPQNYLYSTQLIEMVLYQNYFTGTFFPISSNWSIITNMKALTILDISYNVFEGYLQETYFQTNFSSSITTSSTSISSTSSSSSSVLTFFSINNNYFTGTIPLSLCLLTELQYLGLNDMYLISTIPSSITMQTLSSHIFYFNLGSNILTGSFPSVYNIYLQHLQYIHLGNNYLTGSLPAINQSSALQVVYLQNNQFTSSIPVSLIKGNNLTIFMASMNCLTGTIPDEFCTNNHLSQLILDGLHSSQHCIIPFFHDHSTSSFSQSYHVMHGVHGSLPSCLFDLEKLEIFHVSGNSLIGSFPATKATDGLQYLVSFIVSGNLLTGSIPSYLLQGQFLYYVDFSFNLFTQYDSLGLGANLIQSNHVYYFITQYITPTLYIHENHLSGYLPTSITSETTMFNTSQINVLEGNMFTCTSNRHDLPSYDPHYDSYQCGSDFTNISLYIAFSCLGFLFCVIGWWIYLHFKQSTHSNEAQESQTQQLLTYIYIYLNPFQQTLDLIELTSKQIQQSCNQHIQEKDKEKSIQQQEQDQHQTNKDNIENTNPVHSNSNLSYPIFSSVTSFSKNNSTQPSNLYQMTQISQCIYQHIIILTGYLLLIIIPIYITFSLLYGTYIHQYIWIVSSAYISGTIPSIVLLLLFLGIVLRINGLFILQHKSQWTSWLTNNKDYEQHEINNQKTCFCKGITWLGIFKFGSFILGNILLVLLVNIAYVISINHGYSNTVMTFITLMISLFKFGWNNIVLLGFGRQYIQETLQIIIPTYIILCLAIFNNVIAPYIAEAFVSSNCFLYAITSPPTISTLYYDLQCTPAYVCQVEPDPYDPNIQYTVCNFVITCDKFGQLFNQVTTSSTLSEKTLSSLSYIPPFHYNYTCSSSLLSAFCYVFVYRYIITGIIEPLLFTWIKYCQSQGEKGFLRWKIHMISCGFISNVSQWESVLTNMLPLVMKYEENEISLPHVVDSLDLTDKQPDSKPENKSQSEFCLHEETLSMMFVALEKNVSPGERSLVRFITDITVLLSFGVLFPPLGLLIFISMVKDIVVEQHWLQRLYRKVIISPPSLHLDRICQFLYRLGEAFAVWVSLFWTGLWWSALVSVWFWSFSLYDILGSAKGVGPVRAIWIVLVMGLSPYWSLGLFSCGIRVINRCLSYQHSPPSPSVPSERESSITSTIENIEERLTEMIVTPTNQSLSDRVPSVDSMLSSLHHQTVLTKNSFNQNDLKNDNDKDNIINPLQSV